MMHGQNHIKCNSKLLILRRQIPDTLLSTTNVYTINILMSHRNIYVGQEKDYLFRL